MDFLLRRGLMKGGIRKAAAVIMTVTLLTILGAISVSASAVQPYSHGKLSRFNIQLVIDGSGSLVNGSGATDPNGLRYDAINMFLALLTNEGNNVGAIVFDDKSNPFILNIFRGISVNNFIEVNHLLIPFLIIEKQSSLFF